MSEMYIFRVTRIQEKAEDSPLFDFMIIVMPKMQWTLWMAMFWMAENCGFKWPDMVDQGILVEVQDPGAAVRVLDHAVGVVGVHVLGQGDPDLGQDQEDVTAEADPVVDVAGMNGRDLQVWARRKGIVNRKADPEV